MTEDAHTDTTPDPIGAFRHALGMLPDRPVGRWMLMAPSTKTALQQQTMAKDVDPLEYARLSILGVPVMLDDEMPLGSWRMLDRDGRTVARYTPEACGAEAYLHMGTALLNRCDRLKGHVGGHLDSRDPSHEWTNS